MNNNMEFNDSLGIGKMTEETGTENSYECDAASSTCGMEAIDAEPVDFENNGLLWLLPEPEDEEDERELGLFYDEDADEGATGEWGSLSSSNSFGSGEYWSKDRSSEEQHKKAMKNVVDGHFRALIAQLLQVEKIPIGEEDDMGSRLEIITSLSWEAATLLKPDTSESVLKIYQELMSRNKMLIGKLLMANEQETIWKAIEAKERESFWKAIEAKEREVAWKAIKVKERV